MKLLIDVLKNEYELVRKGNKSPLTELELMSAVANGKPLPENATNRDVISSIFGKNLSMPLATTEEWLDAPYEEVNADADN